MPGFRSFLQDAKISKRTEHEVQLKAVNVDCRLFEFVTTFPIFQASFWQVDDVSEPTLDFPVGGGPQKIEKSGCNKQAALEREPAYWAADLPVNLGQWNFDQIITGYYADANIVVEAMRAGWLDVNHEWSLTA